VVKCGNKIYIFELLNKNQAFKVILFDETYDCKADAKGRVMLPVSLKNQLSPVLNEGFIIKRSISGAYLELWPKAEWDIQKQELNKLNRYVKKNVDFIRVFTAGLKNVEIDSTGRLLIPKNLIETVGIKKEITLSSAVNIIEIWDKASYEKVIKETAANFEALAEDVMGEKSPENKTDVS